MNYLGGLNVITSFLKSRRKWHKKRVSGRSDDQNGQRDAVLLALNMEEGDHKPRNVRFLRV